MVMGPAELAVYVKRWIVGPRRYLHCRWCGRRMPQDRPDAAMCSDECASAHQLSVFAAVRARNDENGPTRR